MAAASSDLTALVDGYCAAWCEADAAARSVMLATVLADGATYTDPTAHVTGADALAAHIGTVLASKPGAKVVRVSRVDAHHDVARFAWQMILADGTALPEGVDFVELSSAVSSAVSSDGARIRGITGFFGPLRRS